MTRSNDSLKVIVVGIPKTMDDSALQDLFGAYGSVADAKVVKDAASDASRGFGFVTFTAQAAMRRAVKEMDKKQLEGRTLNVRQLVAKDQLDKKKDARSEDMAKRPCYLLRKGKCTKGDRCPFSHDTKSGEFGSCFEYVQNGFCKRGDNCKFFHPPPPIDEEGEEGGGETVNGQAQRPQVEREFAPPVKKETQPAEKIETKKPATIEKDIKPKKEPRKEKDDKPRYCFAYQTGRCHRGKRCLYLHQKLVVPEKDAPPAPPASAERKRPGDFEVVKTEEPSAKRRRESDDEEESDAEESSSAKPQREKQAKPVETNRPVVKKEKLTTVDEEADDKPAIGADGKPIHTGPKPICRHFLKGLCKRGHICFFRHERPTDEELEELLPLKGAKKKDENHEEEDDPTALQAVADHMASFMANFKAGAPFEPFVPTAVTEKSTEATIKTEATPHQPPTKRKATIEDVNEAAERQQDEKPAFKRQRPVKKEKVDMGAAFDGALSEDEQSGKRRAPPRKKLTKEQMKANREKLRDERRTKKSTKKLARDRLKTTGEIEFS